MKTKEAINYVESKRYVMEYCDNNKLADEVIELLEEGEKYKKMWEDFKKKLNEGSIYIGESGDYWWGCVAEDMEETKQKYFPKEVKNNGIYSKKTRTTIWKGL